MKMFGSDGFRCQFGTSFMDAKNIINDYPLSPYTWDQTEVTPYHTTKLVQESGYGDWVQSGRLDKYLK